MSHTDTHAEFQLFTPIAFRPATLMEKGPRHSISNICLFYERALSGSDGISCLCTNDLKNILKMITNHPCASIEACWGPRGPQMHTNNSKCTLLQTDCRFVLICLVWNTVYEFSKEMMMVIKMSVKRWRETPCNKTLNLESILIALMLYKPWI